MLDKDAMSRFLEASVPCSPGLAVVRAINDCSGTKLVSGNAGIEGEDQCVQRLQGSLNSAFVLLCSI